MNVEVTSIFYINPDKTFAVVEQLAEDHATEKTMLPGLQMPRTRDELRKYDCIFLGKDIDEVFAGNELKLLQEYSARMGAASCSFDEALREYASWPRSGRPLGRWDAADTPSG
jgi:hypothetical protein